MHNYHEPLGCPVAWLISNREDEATLTAFFKEVQKCCPQAKITTLMTDDGRLYIAMCESLHISSCYTACAATDLAGVNGCVNIYPQVVNLLCKWHVDRYLLVNITA